MDRGIEVEQWRNITILVNEQAGAHMIMKTKKLKVQWNLCIKDTLGP